MKVITARNVNNAYLQGMEYLLHEHIRRGSRAGDVMEAPGPVTTVYVRPYERVLFNDARDANPYFHLMEALWMLAGRRDVAFVQQFNSRIHQYSDDGSTFHGAYGHRWRNHFNVDQLQTAARTLLKDRDTRRVVVQMWDFPDLWREGKDVPCNTHIYFKPKPDMTLDMTVCCRSNDIIWGCYGANVVHMSMLHEWMAAASQMQVGLYRQVSDSYHAYVDVFDKMWPLMRAGHWDGYSYGTWNHPHLPVVDIDPLDWLHEVERFCAEGPGGSYESHWIKNVAVPMWWSWDRYKAKRWRDARTAAGAIAAWDWQAACLTWLTKREGK